MDINANSDTPVLRYRVACAFLYILFAPVAYVLRFQDNADYYRHHIRHALASSFLFYTLLVVFFILGIIGFLLGMYHEDIYFALRIDIVQYILFILLLGLLVLLTFISAIHALRGRSRPVPLITRLSKEPLLPLFSIILSILFTLLLILVVSLAAYSVSVTPSSSEKAQVYMLYDDLDAYPRWIFTLGFLRITMKAIDRLGPDSVCVCKLTQDSFNNAFAKGKFIVLATHGGGSGKIYANGKNYTSHDALLASSQNRPSFIYISGCSVSYRDDSWNRAFPETEVVCFDRWTAVLEHSWWMYTKGPSVFESKFP